MALVRLRAREYRSAATVRATAGQGPVIEYTFNGRRVIEALTDAVERAMQLAQDDAYTYWREVVWTKDQHPFMTGAERDAGSFVIDAQGDPLRPRLVGRVDMSQDYPYYEEFGTRFREGHYPLRRTMDYVAPRIRYYLRRELARETTQGG